MFARNSRFDLHSSASHSTRHSPPRPPSPSPFLLHVPSTCYFIVFFFFLFLSVPFSPFLSPLLSFLSLFSSIRVFPSPLSFSTPPLRIRKRSTANIGSQSHCWVSNWTVLPSCFHLVCLHVHSTNLHKYPNMITMASKPFSVCRRLKSDACMPNERMCKKKSKIYFGVTVRSTVKIRRALHAARLVVVYAAPSRKCNFVISILSTECGTRFVTAFSISVVLFIHIYGNERAQQNYFS